MKKELLLFFLSLVASLVSVVSVLISLYLSLFQQGFGLWQAVDPLLTRGDSPPVGPLHTDCTFMDSQGASGPSLKLCRKEKLHLNRDLKSVWQQK